jgi:hypothetical protein
MEVMGVSPYFRVRVTVALWISVPLVPVTVMVEVF